MADEQTIDGLPILKKNKSQDTIDGLPILKKKAIITDVAPTSPQLPSGGGLDPNSLQSTATNLPYSPITDVKTVSDNVQHATQHQAIEQDKQQHISDQLNKLTKSFDPETKKNFELAQQAANTKPSDEIHGYTPEENSHIDFMKTPLGKTLGAVKYLGSKATKGSLQVAKGAAWLANEGLNNGALKTAVGIGNDEVLDKADKAADFGLTKSDVSHIEDSKTMSNLGSLAEIAPVAASGKLTSEAAMFALQGFGNGKDQIEQAEKKGVDINPNVKTAFILGNGAAMAALMKIPIFKSIPAGLRGDAAALVTANIIKDNAGKELTGTSYKELLDNGVKDLGDKVKQFGLDYLKNTNKAAVDLSALHGANFLLKKGVDATTDQPVFNESIGDLAEGIGNVLKSDAPIFGAAGVAGKVPELLRHGIGETANQLGLDGSKLTKYSTYKNSVVESLMHDPSEANIGRIKDDITKVGLREGNWSNDDLNATIDHVDKIAEVAKKLPRDLAPNKVVDAVDLVNGRDELKNELAKVQAERGERDEAIKDIPSAGEQLLIDKIDQANDKLRSIATGKQIYYGKEKDEKTGEETGKFYKLMDGKKEEIPESRYELENLERESKKQTNEEPAPIAEATTEPVSETPQVSDQPIEATNSEPVVEAPKNTEVAKEPINEETINPPLNKIENESTNEKGGSQESREENSSENANGKESHGNEEKGLLSKSGDPPAEPVTKEHELSHEDAVRQAIEKETNPKNIAAQYHTESSYPDTIEKAIIDYVGGSKINEKDYKRITGNDAPHGGISRWIDTKNSDKTDINTHAEIISHDLGVQVTPEDIVETIDRYTGRKNFEEANKSDTQKLLESRYEELTGKKLTARRAEKAHGSLAKELTPAQVEEFNKHAKEIGITQEDIDNYERARKQSDRGADKPRDAKPAKDKVREPKNEQGGRTKESDGGKGVESKAGDPLRSFAEKVRNGKINKLGGFKASTGFDTVWDGSLEVVAKSLETGAKVADAIEAGLKHVRGTDWYKSLADKENFDEQYRNHLTNEYTEHEKTLPTKNEVSNERAADLGVELKDTKNGKRGADKIESDATAEIDKGYDTPDLIDRILNDGHQASDTEIAILGKYMDAKEAEIKTQNERLAKDGATMSKKQFDELTEDNTQSLNEFQDAAQANRKTGTETARALNARKLSFNKEATLANMIVAKRQANGGNKLSAEQLAQVQKTHAELESIQEALQKKIAKLEEDNAKLKANQSVRKAADRIKRKSISKDELRSERNKIFDSIREDFAKIRKSGQAMSDIPYRRELSAIAKHMPALLRNLAQEGLVEIKDVVDRIHEEFVKDIPDLTKRDVTDLIAGKYDEVKPTKKEIQNDISSLKTQAKLLNEIEDLQNGIKKAKPESANAKKKNERVEALRGRLKELNKENEPTDDQKKLDAYKKRIQENIDKLNKRLADEDYEKGEKPKPLTLDAEGVDLRRKYDKIKREFDIEVAKDALKQRSKTEKLKDDLLNIASLPRALKASLDFSAVLRQGLFATVNHPKEALHAFTEMFKQTFSEEKYKNWMSDLKHSEHYDLMKESELYLSDKDDPKIIAREEEFTSNLADKIPGIGKLVAASERAYTGYLNVLRAGVFEQQAKELIKRGYTFENNPEVFKGIAKVVNVLTGRGDIPEAFGGKQPKVLSNVLFSPRFMAARIQTLYLWADPRLPKEAKVMAAKDIGATLAVGGVLLSLAAMAGLKVVTDPRSSNFLKAEDKQAKGSTYYDILGGLPQYVRLLSQMASGQKVPGSGKGVIDLTTGKYGKPSRLSLATSFMRGKLSPLIGSGINLMESKDVVGQPYHFWPNVPQEFVPLPFTDVQEAYQVGGIKNGLKAFLPSQFGISTSSYNPNAKIKKK